MPYIHNKKLKEPAKVLSDDDFYHHVLGEKRKITEIIRLDPRGPLLVQHYVNLWIQKWHNVTPIKPDHFLMKIFQSRGYCCDKIKPTCTNYAR